MGAFLKASCGYRDKEISEQDKDDPRQGIHAHPSIKGCFLPPPVRRTVMLVLDN